MSSEPAHAQHESHRARRLTVFIEYGDRAGRRHIYFEVLKRARRAKLAGLTTFQGDLGYGYSGRLHHTHLLGQDSPLSIVIVDRPDRVDAFIEEIGDLVSETFMVVADVDVVEP
jgi:uncharacterized protein